jgi:hypothetical protein
VAHVAEAHVVGGVEALLGAEVPLGQRAERLLDGSQALLEVARPGHRAEQYPLARRLRLSHTREPNIRSRVRPMREIRLHDTRNGRVVTLEPREPGKGGHLRLRATVYNRIHIGNARPYVVFSLLKRFLAHEGLRDDALVINVTDVNDKLYDAARPLGISSDRLAAT